MNTKAPFNLFDLDRSDGQYLISSYGNLQALGYYGSERFCQLAENLIINFGMTNGRIHKATDQIFYIITSQEKFEKSIQTFLETAIRVSEVKAVISRENEDDEGEVTWDEATVQSLAKQRVQWFMEHVVKRDNFILDLSRGAPNVA